jgi:hypothetical protein
MARVARAWEISRASVYRSLKETPPNTIARRPGPVGAVPVDRDTACAALPQEARAGGKRDQVILNPAADLVEGQTVNSRTVAAPDP